MNVLSQEKQAAIIAALCEGVSIRATARLLDVHKDSVMSLGLRVGQGCTAVHGKLMTNLQVHRIECDEIWGFVKKKRKNVTEADGDDVGDQYTYLAQDALSKAILSWIVGKRNYRNTQRLMDDLRYRVINQPEISTDGFHAYARAVNLAFDGQASHGLVDKQTVIIAGDADQNGYYAKEQLVAVKRTAIAGNPRHISTSFIERQNLNLRQTQRRMTRQSSGHSKKFESHCAAIALHCVHHNFVRIHETLRMTPGMFLGITDHIWSHEELVAAALSKGAQMQVKRAMAGFRVIQGGKD